MKRILQYLKDYKKESVLAPLFKMLEAAFELLIPIVMSNIIDVGIGNRDTGYVIRMCLVMVLLGVVGLLCSVTAQYFSAKAATGFGTALRDDLFTHITSLSYSEIDSVGTSTLLTRMTSDTNQVQTGVNMVLRLFLRSPFIVFGAMIMSFTIDVKSAMTFVVTIPALSIVVFGVMALGIPLYKKVQSSLDKVTLLTREGLSGARVIRAFNRQEKDFEAFDESTDELMKFQLVAGRISAVMNPVTYVIINISTAAIIWIAAGQTDVGILTQGKVVALVNYMSQILVELIKLANLIVTITKAMACAKRIDSVMEIQPSVVGKSSTGNATGSNSAAGIKNVASSDNTAGTENMTVGDNTAGTRSAAGENNSAGGGNIPRVEFRNVSLRYGEAAEDSLSDISFKVAAGQTVGIIGGTGSGKSSLINMIPRFYDARSGQVLVDGVDVKDYNLQQLRGKIGVVPQKAVLFQGTIAENIRWGKRDATDEEVDQALEVAQAKNFVDEKDGGKNFKISQGGKNLSGGQKQRLTIARALVRKPEILILDDSASALDFATDAALRKAIRNSSGNTTLFIVSQRASTIMNSDEIVVMDDGQIAGIGSHAELLKTCEVYREICSSQLSEEEMA
jgi:ABC-type multidrug transport system fused ATPase/permease subunit